MNTHFIQRLTFLSFFCFAASLLSGCAIYAIMTPKKSHPPLEGMLEAKGLKQAVTIFRDQYGVPHIRAENERDLWFTIGYLQAQDRLFQLDLIRRLGTGTMSEIFGDDAIDYDTFIQGLDLFKDAAQKRALANPELIEVGDAYTEGINAGAASLPELPVEYRVLGIDFKPWRPSDSLAIRTINAWTMAENPAKELVSFMLRKKLSVEMANALWRWDPQSQEVEAYWDEVRQYDMGDINAPMKGFMKYLWKFHEPSASNNWAIAGNRSSDGFPILASDPHMHQMAPSVWYVVEGRGGDVHIAGGVPAGSPFAAIGHNEKTAWGITNVMADYVDVAVLERVGDNGYLLGGQGKVLREVKVNIAVKGEDEPVKRTVYWSEVGPIISELTGTHLLALRWTLFELEDEMPQVFYDMQKAQSVDEHMEAVQASTVISQNLVVADTDGNIGWQIFGGIPKRKGFSGRMPYPASNPEYDWDGWLEELPSERNPERGYITTANNRPDHALATEISTAYLPNWRRDRIAELIEGQEKHDLESNRKIQLDWFDAHAKAKVPELLADVPEDFNDCSTLLKTWDYQSTPESIAASVWAIFQDELIRHAIADDVGEREYKIYVAAAVNTRTVIDANLEAFVDDKNATIKAALTSTCALMHEEFGEDKKEWRWGKLHALRIKHPMGAESRLLKSWNMPEIEYGGSHATVNQAGFSWYHETLETNWMASMRLLVPMSDPGSATFIYPGGQSGHPAHPHYKSLMQTFADGKQVPLYFNDEDVQKNAVHILKLFPKQEEELLP
ncbi:MAG: penicillin acylase family protein [Myxococcota bacterium]|nr:penicillin acylase family protein [Myxococcota bacterium]